MNVTQQAKINRAINVIEEQKSILDDLRSMLQEKFYVLSEEAQEGEKGEALQTAINALESADSNLDSVVSDIEEARDA